MKKNVMWNTVGSIFYCFCQWLITIVVVHIASYADAGYLSLAMTTSSSFSAISLFSMRNYQVSDVVREFRTDTYIGSRVLTCVIALVSCTVVGFWSNSLQQALCINAFMLVRVAEGIVDVLHGINQKYEKYNYIGISYILRGIATIVSFVVVLIASGDLVLTLYIMAFDNLLVAVVFDCRKTYSLERFRPELWGRKLWELLRKCFPIVIFTFLLSLENLIPKNILQQQFGAEELGIYSSIASPTLVVQVFANVAFNPFLPQFSLLYNRGDIKKLKQMLHKVYFFMVSMCILVSLGVLVFGRLGLQILFGENILKYYYLFYPIVWCTILTAIIYVLSAIMIALRRTVALVVGMIIDFGICVYLAPGFIAQYEKNGVSLIQILVLAIYIAFLLIICEYVIRRKEKRVEKHTRVK